MGKATLAKQKAIGQIGQARVQKLYDADLVVIAAAEYEQLKTRIAVLERANRLLSDLTSGTQELREAMGR